jgi:hypothetical protein
MAMEKIKLGEEAISEILVADTALESGAKASDVEDYFEEAAAAAAAAEVAITNTDHGNHQPKCAAVCVLAAKERAHSAPDVTWSCAQCLVSQNITQK